MIIKGFQKKVASYRIPSKTKKGEYHYPEMYSDGSWKCSCEAVKECWAIKMVKYYEEGSKTDKNYEISLV